MIEGGCFCGALRIVIDEGQYPSLNCHCTMCRRAHAAAFVTWMVVPAERFRYLSGTPAKLVSSKGGTRYFCADCGTHVACVNGEHPDIVDVAVCCVDQPERFPPTSSIFVDTRLDWHG